ncbi:MAG: TolC family protein [Acidobacteriota bacterium]|nr:TolC family protein [Acidobacteriota bacterium]
MIGRLARMAQIGLCLTLGGAPALAQTPLGADEVLVSVEQSLPLLERARRDVDLARGEAVEARGAFDLKVKAEGLAVRGFYDNDRVKSVLEQPLAPLGLNVFGGYRAGRGVFGPYDGKAATLSDGKWTAGAELPLLRDRAIDTRRAGRQVADLGVEVATRGLDKARLTFFKDALAAYWNWVAAGRQLAVARDLLRLAEARDQQLADAVALGQTAPVERIDNQRAILQRRSALATAERLLQLSAIDLSLYYRAADGSPVRAPADRLPSLPPPPAGSEPDESEEIQSALARRPELQALRLKREQQQAELRLAENSVLPTLNLFSEVSSDSGTGAPNRAGSSFEAGVVFELPVQRRKATGKSLQAQAKLSGLDQDLRWAEDQVRADVQDAISALRAARAVLDVVTEELRVARELEGLERDRFQLGDSTQFLVNLRELTTADAALREVKALADYQKALVSVESATGQLVDRVPQP